MNVHTLTNVLLTGILLMQAYALIFRAPAERGKRRGPNEDYKTTGNPPNFPPS